MRFRNIEDRVRRSDKHLIKFCKERGEKIGERQYLKR